MADDNTPLIVRGIQISSPGRVAPDLAEALGAEVNRGYGDARVPDVPIPNISGTFDQAFVWVCRNPAEALLLRSVGIYAVALAAPCDTLGSRAGIEWLMDLGVLTHPDERPPKAPGRQGASSTIVVVDPGERLGSGRGEWLRGIYEHVVEATHEDGSTSHYLTGAGLAQEIATCLQNSYLAGRIERELRDMAFSHGVVNLTTPTLIPQRSREQRSFHGPAARRPLALVQATDLDAKGDTTPWVAEPFAAARAITDLHGPTKAGKTTLLLGLAKAVTQGEYFLGHKCQGGPVVYVTEQTEGTIRASAFGASALVPGLHFLTLEAVFGRGLDEIVAFIRRECKTLNARLVVIDTLGPIARLSGDDNSPGEARGVYRSLRPLTFDGLAVIVVRHSRKARGSIYETAAGSVAFAGEADQLVRFRWLNGDDKSELREIEAVGRLGDFEEMTVRLTEQGWIKVEAEAGGKSRESSRPRKAKQSNAHEAVFRILGAAEAAWMTKADIVVLTKNARAGGYSDSAVFGALKALMETGDVASDETARPHRYALSTRSIQSAPVGGGNE